MTQQTAKTCKTCRFWGAWPNQQYTIGECSAKNGRKYTGSITRADWVCKQYAAALAHEAALRAQHVRGDA